MSNQIIAEASNLLEGFRDDLQPIVAENGQSYDRLKTTFMIAVQQNPDILKCTPESLRREISKCAADGLVPDNKEAVLLPYWDKDAKAHIANYQPMVYGIIKRMKELGSVFNIVAEIVCEGDKFTFNAADPDSLDHHWDIFSGQARGETRAAYAIFRDDQKRVMHREIMSLAELQAVRNASKAPNSPAWRNFEGEMYQKAVLRRGSKYISINNDKIRQLLERQDALYDFRQPRQAERVNPFTGEVIEGEAAARTGATHALEDRREMSMQSLDGSRERQEVERSQAASSGGSRRQQKPAEDFKETRSDQREHKKAEADTKKDEPKKPSGPPAFPADIEVFPADKDRMQECAEKILAIPLNQEINAKARHDALAAAAINWKGELPEELTPLVRACIEMSQWANRQAAEDKPWTGEHAQFVHKMKTLLEVEKLNIGKYP